MKFVNLYTETEYSLLSSPNKIDELVNKAYEYHYNALAITDYNNMYGAIKFYSACKEKGIKPIFGLHFDVSDINILVYAKSMQGYKELLKLATISKMGKDIKIDELKGKVCDCIVIIPGDENKVVKMLLAGEKEEASELLINYQSIFKDLYLGIDLQTLTMKENILNILNFANVRNIPCVALQKVSYLEKDSFEAYQYLKCIGMSLNDYPYSEKEMHSWLLTRLEAEGLFSKYKELIDNSYLISDKCNVEITFDTYRMPKYVGEVSDNNQYLKDLSMVGLKKRLNGKKVNANLYLERLLYELDVIVKMGFSDYFLIVYDYIKYAKMNGILVGPGRGSAPGSLVSYSLGITDIDPIKNDLLFERFLNPERTSMPDIDTDFPDNRRDEVIRYMGKRHGKERVAHISTFGTFGVRLAIRDVARVMKLDEVYLNEILKCVENRFDDIKTVYENKPIFKRMVDEDLKIKTLYNVVRKIEGLPRHISVHAAGIIMADTELNEYTALQPGINGLYQTQFEASDLEKIGLVKFDFLGLRNLTIIDSVIRKIKKTEEFNLNRINYNDIDTYKMIASGDTDGIFQLESSGMRNTLMKLKTSSFIDIVNALALYRPGPMEMIPSFIKRKFKEEKVEYIHPDLEEILKPTYGAIVFQEQILLIAQKFAGYSLGQADILRRAVSKKKADMLQKERERFVLGAKKIGHDEKTSNLIYDYIVKFANYGFNKSHSVAYSIVAYQMAYLKNHYYKHFMAELMSNTIGNIRLIKTYISNCQKRKIKVFLPSINKSSDKFESFDEGIYYSLLGIQNLGSVSLDSFLAEREKNGLYHSYDEFVRRTKNIFNKRIVESMIYSGALDEFNIPRKQMVLEYDNSLELSNYGDILKGQLSERTFDDEEYSFEEISKLEREVLGFNFKYDIFSRYSHLKDKYKTVDLAELKNGAIVNALFSIDGYRLIKTKNEKEMAFITIADETDRIDAVLFPETFAKYKGIIKNGGIYLGKGKVEIRNEKLQMIFENIAIVK